MREYMNLIQTMTESNEKLQELFGFSQKEKDAKAQEALAGEFKEALKINDVLERSRKVDDLAVKALANRSLPHDFFKKLGFTSDVGVREGQFLIPNYWHDKNRVLEYKTIFGVETLVGELTGDGFPTRPMKQAKELGGWMPNYSPDKAWVKSGSHGWKMIYHFKAGHPYNPRA